MPGLALLLSLALTPVGAQQSSDRVPSPKRPAIGLSVDDDAAAIAARPTFGFWNGAFELTPIVKAGALAPFGMSDVSYPMLLPSPFGLVGLKAKATGPLEVLVVATHGVMDMTTQRLGGPLSSSVASPTVVAKDQDQYNQRLAVTSLHADAGKVFGIGDAWKAAVYAASDAWFARPQHGDAGDSGGMVGRTYSGGVVTSRRSGIHELTLNAQVQGESAAKTMWRNYEYTMIPSGSAGAEYALVDGGKRAAVGAEVVTSPADQAIRPFIKWQDPRLALTVAADLRQTKNSFYPDRKAIGVEAGYELKPGINLQFTGQVGQERYAMAPEPTNVYRALVGVSIDLGHKIEARVARSVAASDGGRRAFDPQRAVALNESVSAAQTAVDFRQAMLNSASFEDFVAKYPAKGTGAILASVSRFTESISKYNYNLEESPETPNVNDAKRFYERVRASFLSGKEDPITVCIGSAQFGALLAQELGKRDGVRIDAAAVSVRVPHGNGSSGHAVSAVKTGEYGIVFVDWGKLTPTYTWDTKEAMRIYQALQGVPAMYHEMSAGPDGKPVGYLFTEEGKLILRQMTAYGELPQGTLERMFRETPSSGPRAAERYRELVRGR
ncbi:MAG: hypothetical protein HY925_11690 [Elusimicrobia bacterium]|nr:hypothetical protein [Elusimicrobiota bacterium]